jgi:hypothetical protein
VADGRQFTDPLSVNYRARFSGVLKDLINFFLTIFRLLSAKAENEAGGAPENLSHRFTRPPARIAIYWALLLKGMQ